MINEFLPFAIGTGSNVETQANYAPDPAVVNGFAAGTAFSNKFNKVWRQGTVVAAMLGQFIANNQALDVHDDGNLTLLLSQYQAALQGYLYSGSVPIVRIRLSAPATFYIGGAGASDVNPGTSGAPWATLGHGISAINSQYDNGGFPITFQCAGPFTSTLALGAPMTGATAAQNLIFNFAAGSSITVTNAPCVLAVGGGNFTIQGPVVLTSTGTSGILAGFGVAASPGSSVIVGNQVVYGACSAAHNFGAVSLAGPTYGIAGSAPFHYQALLGAVMNVVSGAFSGTVNATLTGTPTFTAFADARSGGIINIGSGVSYTGAAIGSKYFVDTSGIINTGGSGPSFFPGSTAGTVDASTFGLYL